MKNKIYLLAIGILLMPSLLHAQLQKVFVETYYISDANDATDTTGGYLAPGSKTYRVYVQLVKGSSLQKLYGDADHAIWISSTDTFFNNKADGKSFGKDFPKNRLGENTVALDTWLTLGQTTRSSVKTYFGVPKPNDDDGSFIGGTNNDGGSAGGTGLLSNNDVLAGIPLTQNDGMDTLVDLPTTWGDYGIFNIVYQTDSTVFGSIVPGNLFYSNDAGIFNSGVRGVLPDSNQILIAQLTTKGDISFELNIEVVDTAGEVIKYVANDSILNTDEILSRYLKFPYEPVCGCPDPSYMEFMAGRDCDDWSLCQSKVVFGCLDPMACNYNPDANYNIESLCCYPGYCNDRDISIVCPAADQNRVVSFNIYPNPVSDFMNLEVNETGGAAQCMIYNAFGKKVMQEIITSGSNHINIEKLENGLYIIQVVNDSNIQSGTFMKN